jgi:hypothetical protein
VTSDPALLGWCAGLLDGEGSIGIYGKSLTVRIVMTDEPTIRRVRELLGIGWIHACTPRPPRRPAWYWFIGHRRRTYDVLTALRPYLVTKAQQADLALRFLRDAGLSSEDRKDLARAIASEKHPRAASADECTRLLSRPSAQLDLRTLGS